MSSITFAPSSGLAATAAEISQNAKAALHSLYSSNPTARAVGKKAKAVLVFPSVVKGGFLAGGQRGDGALLSNGRTLGYCNTTAASYGLQAGLQKFGYAMFFMNDASLNYLRKSGGWEVGSAPSLGCGRYQGGKVALEHNAAERYLCFLFQSEGFDGRPSFAGSKDHSVQT